jgi:hypothetical protein
MSVESCFRSRDSGARTPRPLLAGCPYADASQGLLGRATVVPSLELSEHDSEIARWGRWERTYRSAVRVDGCGQIVEHNDLHENPHSAIRFAGNEHRLRYNRIWNVTNATNDAGVIYTGRDWGYRGTEISNNFIHHVESIFGGSHGIYLDDAASGIQVTGNVLYRIRGLATFNGGGRDNVFANNVIVDAIGTHSADRRARTSNYNFASNGKPDSWNLLGRINVVYETYSQDYPNVQDIDYQSGVWASRYPALAAIPNDWPQVQASHWQDPEGSVFSRNVFWRSNPGMVEGTWGGSGAYELYSEIAANLEADPLFVDEAGLDLALRPESPAFTIPGFQPIPFAEIGIRPATRRTLTVSRLGSGVVASVAGGIDCGAACQAWFDDGTSVRLRATPAPRQSFAGWSGPCSGTDDCLVTLTQDTLAVATFGTGASLELTIDDASVAEGSSGTQEITVKVHLGDRPTPQP